MKQKYDDISKETWLRYHRKPTQALRDEIYYCYHDYSQKIASNYIKRRVGLTLHSQMMKDDCYTWASMGLLQAMEKYDVEKGKRFSSYAYKRIHGEIMDGMRREGEKLRSAFYFPMKRIEEIEHNLRSGMDGDNGSVEILPAPEPPCTKMEIDDWLGILRRDIFSFTDRDIQMVRLKFVDGFNNLDISKVVGMSESRISQIFKKKIMVLLKEYYLANPSAII